MCEDTLLIFFSFVSILKFVLKISLVVCEDTRLIPLSLKGCLEINLPCHKICFLPAAAAVVVAIFVAFAVAVAVVVAPVAPVDPVVTFAPVAPVAPQVMFICKMPSLQSPQDSCTA